MEKKPINSWVKEERPREKLIQKGASSLTDSELVAILLGSGSRDMSAVELSQLLLKGANYKFSQLARLSYDELLKVKGIGQAKAVSLIAALEVGRRRKLEVAEEKKKVTSSSDVAGHFVPVLQDAINEEFWILLLNRANYVIEKIKISQGGLAGTVTDVRIILKHALDKRASSLILCHNHPSGNKNPSSADRKITTRIKEAAAYLELNVLDHIIIYEDQYLSFADEGLL